MSSTSNAGRQVCSTFWNVSEPSKGDYDWRAVCRKCTLGLRLVLDMKRERRPDSDLSPMIIHLLGRKHVIEIDVTFAVQRDMFASGIVCGPELSYTGIFSNLFSRRPFPAKRPYYAIRFYLFLIKKWLQHCCNNRFAEFFGLQKSIRPV